ncbi:MAG: hypothetical protein JST86_05650 [Bacteroidetes bacterium]|nr:hypothetical protein [Bacteroidota bacterium]
MKYLLLLLLSFVAVTALVSGAIICIDPGGSFMQLNPAVLQNTPFHNFLIPGLVLTFVVGASNAAAVLLLVRRSPAQFNAALFAGLMITGWITVQVLLIQTFHWLQLVYVVAGVFIMLSAYQLKGKWAV